MNINKEVYLAKRYIRKVENAANSNTPFSITFSQYKKAMSRKVCPYLNVPLSHKVDSEHYSTLDRIDHNKGYVVGNIIACSKKANHLKGIMERHATLEEVKNLIKGWSFFNDIHSHKTKVQ